MTRFYGLFCILSGLLAGCGNLGSGGLSDPVPGTDLVRSGVMNCGGSNAGNAKVYRVGGVYVLRLEGFTLPSSMSLPLFVTANVSGSPNVLFSAALRGASGDQNYTTSVNTTNYAPTGWAVVEIRIAISTGSASCTASLI